jgi:autotransporter adhesin
MNSATGASNTALGELALTSLTSGAQNVAVGVSAGTALSTGSDNVYVGHVTQSGAAVANAVAVGSGATASASNTVAIGKGTSAGAAGAVAIGIDSGAVAASSAVVDQINIGTATHTIMALGKIKYGTAGNAQTTVGAAGGATAQPATPLGYFKFINSAGVTVAVPFHNAV